MNHQPFENWLLDDQPLSLEEKRELTLHVRDCEHCKSLAETGLALRSTRMRSPAPGFTARFQERLEAQRIAQRRRNFWGVILFTLAGLGAIALLVAPLLARIADTPAEWISLLVGLIIFVLSSIQALVEVGFVLLRVAPGFIPPYLWLIPASGVAGLSLLWAVSIWRLTRAAQGA
jgi:hypothetical protein